MRSACHYQQIKTFHLSWLHILIRWDIDLRASQTFDDSHHRYFAPSEHSEPNLMENDPARKYFMLVVIYVLLPTVEPSTSNFRAEAPFAKSDRKKFTIYVALFSGRASILWIIKRDKNSKKVWLFVVLINVCKLHHANEELGGRSFSRVWFGVKLKAEQEKFFLMLWVWCINLAN